MPRSFFQPCKLSRFFRSRSVREHRNRNCSAAQNTLLRCHSPSPALRRWQVPFVLVSELLLASSPRAPERILRAKALSSSAYCVTWSLPPCSALHPRKAFHKRVRVPGSHLVLEMVPVSGGAATIRSNGWVLSSASLSPLTSVRAFNKCAY